jgi:hypothetical protein
MLNHPPAIPCPELDLLSSASTLDITISEDAPTHDEVLHAIRKLRNGRAAGPDGIPPELLKVAETSVCTALHGLFL